MKKVQLIIRYVEDGIVDVACRGGDWKQVNLGVVVLIVVLRCVGIVMAVVLWCVGIVMAVVLWCV
jgi:hypothetical protein